MIITVYRTPLFQPRQPLLKFLNANLPRLKNGDIVVVTSKIVALAAGRVVPCRTETEKVALIKKESQLAIHTKYTWLTIKDGMVMAAAGIDQSNANDQCILLPINSPSSARSIRQALMRRFRLRRLGVIITDSRLIPLRKGITGVALGYAGFRGLRNYIGTPDLFGRKLEVSQTNVADSLAAAAVLLMGEGAERQPLAVIQKAPVVFVNRVPRKELFIDPADDIYRPLFERLPKQAT